MGANKELYGFVITSKIRKGILEALRNGKPLLQSEIARKMGKTQPDISKAVLQLEKKLLIECLTPDKKTYKAYEITPLGKETLALF